MALVILPRLVKGHKATPRRFNDLTRHIGDRSGQLTDENFKAPILAASLAAGFGLFALPYTNPCGLETDLWTDDLWEWTQPTGGGTLVGCSFYCRDEAQWAVDGGIEVRVWDQGAGMALASSTVLWQPYTDGTAHYEALGLTLVAGTTYSLRLRMKLNGAPSAAATPGVDMDDDVFAGVMWWITAPLV